MNTCAWQPKLPPVRVNEDWTKISFPRESSTQDSIKLSDTANRRTALHSSSLEAAEASDPYPPAPAPKQKNQLPDLKKPPAEATPAEVRAQITALVRQSLPELTKVLQDAKANDERKEKEKLKQAT